MGSSNPIYLQFPNQEQVDSEKPPMRVLVALQFLHSITGKRMSRICPIGEYKCDVVEGLKLTPTEINAEKHAHDLLIDYFKGDLKADWREQINVDAIKAEQEYEMTPPKERTLMKCPQCDPRQPDSRCLFCEGSGWAMIVPAKKREEMK